jgi:hypothetical protein
MHHMGALGGIAGRRAGTRDSGAGRRRSWGWVLGINVKLGKTVELTRFRVREGSVRLLDAVARQRAGWSLWHGQPCATKTVGFRVKSRGIVRITRGGWMR